jgi:ornithine carbamoyltransferase
MAHSWLNAAAVLELDLTMACPQNYFPSQKILDDALKKNPDKIKVTTDPLEAVQGADVINTDVWASMGQESEQKTRRAVFEPYQVNAALVARAADDVIVMHCLPAHREEEITEEVLEGPHSVVWDQSENKLHMHKAILEILMRQ